MTELLKTKVLTVISHTEHYLGADKSIRGWGPTVREINFLAGHFKKVIHVAVLHEGLPPASALPYESHNITLMPLPHSGGKSLIEKAGVLRHAPAVINAVSEAVSVSDLVQLRVPTGIANYLLPYLSKIRKKPKLWVKYAGNWNQQQAPAGYAFQRWWLKNNFLNCPVTINGRWDGQPDHCFTFENPCLDRQERLNGWDVLQRKDYSAPLGALFVGRIEEEKGVGRILDSLPQLQQMGVRSIDFVGDGKLLDSFRERGSAFNGICCRFHGPLSRYDLVSLFESSHLLLLPSTASEGFPKVVAEGANYGVVPVVSDVSSISQYINDTNGYLWPSKSHFGDWVLSQSVTAESLKSKAEAAYKMAGKFTFEHYLNQLQTHIIGDNFPA
jgi:glycosyltransferase involved in cell wall biosynthesis